MAYKLVKAKGGYKLYKINEKKFAKTLFKSKQAAINQALNWMRYRGEKGKVVGNAILLA